MYYSTDRVRYFLHFLAADYLHFCLCSERTVSIFDLFNDLEDTFEICLIWNCLPYVFPVAFPTCSVFHKKARLELLGLFQKLNRLRFTEFYEPQNFISTHLEHRVSKLFWLFCR